jgi:hypothetical protein
MKLLYLMGATWTNKCMFDLDTVEDSFADILKKQNVEVFTFDILDSHQENLDHASKLIEEFGIDYLMGYSYGCVVAKELAKKHKLKGIMFLDPFAAVVVESIEMNNRLFITEQAICKALEEYKTNIKQSILQDYLKMIVDRPFQIYPKKVVKEQFEGFNIKDLTCALQVFLTKTPKKFVEMLFPKEIIKRNSDASHWILLEDHRYWLADQVVKFMSLQHD